MPTVNQIISDVRNDLNRVNFNGYVPARYLHAKLIDTAKLFIKREADDRRLGLYPDIWVTTDKFDMEEADLIGCSDISIPKCTKVMKSKLKLPEIYTTRYGYLINISSIDYTRDYIQTTPREYVDKMARRYQNPNLRYFWIYNGHLIIPSSMVGSVTLRTMFCDKAQGLRLEGCKDPGCIKTLDQDFVAPGHLLDDIKSYTVQKIAGIRDKIPTGNNPDLNDAHEDSAASIQNKR